MGEMLERILDGLNEAQREAVLAVTGPVAIVAGAGTGKTTTVTRRIAAQVDAELFAPEQILAVTFSVKAAGELRERLTRLGVRGVRANTFHAEALGQYRRFVDQDADLLAHKAQILHGLVGRLPPPHRFTALRDLATEIEWAKNRRIGVRDYLAKLDGHAPPIAAELMHGLYLGYEKEKRRRGVLDFEDLLERTLQHLTSQDRDLGVIRSRYAAFTVDEYQDVNLLQESLLRQWVGARDDLCVVGDDYQAIYGFTGATPSYLLGFEDRYPHAVTVTLTDNHRSTPEILALANRLVPKLGGSRKRLEPTLPSGPEPEVRAFASADDEVAWVVTQMKRLIGTGTKPSEIALLVRINARTEPFEEAFARNGIPYQVRDGSFLQRPAVRGFLAKARRSSPDAPVLATVLEVTDGLGFSEADDDLAQEERTRQADLARLRQLAEGSTADGLAAFITDLLQRFSTDADGHGVVLMSMHRSKGLEYEAVFLPHLEDGELPIRHAKTAEEIAEERRLFYVAITRAKRFVALTRAVDRGRRSKQAPSPFLRELSDEPAAGVAAGSPGASQRKPSPVKRLATMAGDPLFEALRTWRRRRADAAGVPAYVVFPDATLTDIARQKPTDRAMLRSISGVGPIKMQRYGDEVLEVLAQAAS